MPRVICVLAAAGTDAQRIYVLDCTRADKATNVLVVDHHMRLRFASTGVSALLGYPARRLATMRLDQLLPAPYNTLHAKWTQVGRVRVTLPYVKCMQDCRCHAAAVVWVRVQRGRHVAKGVDVGMGVLSLPYAARDGGWLCSFWLRSADGRADACIMASRPLLLARSQNPPPNIPPTSCRAGKVVHLLNEAGSAVPVRIKVSAATGSGGGVNDANIGALNVVQVRAPAVKASWIARRDSFVCRQICCLGGVSCTASEMRQGRPGRVHAPSAQAEQLFSFVAPLVRPQVHAPWTPYYYPALVTLTDREGEHGGAAGGEALGADSRHPWPHPLRVAARLGAV